MAKYNSPSFGLVWSCPLILKLLKKKKKSVLLLRLNVNILFIVFEIRNILLILDVLYKVRTRRCGGL